MRKEVLRKEVLRKEKQPQNELDYEFNGQRDGQTTTDYANDDDDSTDDITVNFGAEAGENQAGGDGQRVLGLLDDDQEKPRQNSVRLLASLKSAVSFKKKNIEIDRREFDEIVNSRLPSEETIDVYSFVFFTAVYFAGVAVLLSEHNWSEATRAVGKMIFDTDIDSDFAKTRLISQ
eukprot:1187504-Prorocentrum_minimum.AAC.1